MSVLSIFRLKRFIKAETGVAAVEFGLFFPIFAFLVFGGYATFTLVQADRSVERTATILSDLTSRLSYMDQTTANNLIEIGKSLSGSLADDNSYKVRLSSISNTFDTSNNYDLVVDWSYSSEVGDELKVSEIGNFEIPYIPEGESTILVTVEADFLTTYYSEIHGLVSFEESSVRRPRFVPLVALQ